METKNFKQSKNAENFKKNIKQYVEIILENQVNKDQSQFITINKSALTKAFTTLCNLWNKDEKSRNFVKHLIGAFYRNQKFNKIMTFSEDVLSKKNNKCALTGYWLCGIKDIANCGSTMLIHNAKLGISQQQYKENPSVENKQKLDEAIANYNNEFNKFPITVRNSQFAYYSQKSDKFLSNEAAIALNMFTTEMIMFNEQEVIFTLNKRKISHFNKYEIKNNKLSKAEVNKIAKANTYNVFDEKTLNKLLKVKEELDSKYNKIKKQK